MLDTPSPDLENVDDHISELTGRIVAQRQVVEGFFSSDLRLAYCNAPFRELRDLPEALSRPGTPLVEIVHYIAFRGDYGSGEAAEQVERRMAEIRRMQPWEVEQETPGGLRLLISHTPAPAAG